MGLICIFNFTELICVTVTGSVEFANGNLVEDAWIKPGLVEKLDVVLFFASFTAGGLAACPVKRTEALSGSLVEDKT